MQEAHARRVNKEIHKWTHHSKHSENQMRKFWKQEEKNTWSCIRDPNKINNWFFFFSRNNRSRRKWDNIFKVLKENNGSQGYYIQQSYLSKMKGKQRHSQINQSWENLLLGDPPYKKCKGSFSGIKQMTPNVTSIHM